MVVINKRRISYFYIVIILLFSSTNGIADDLTIRFSNLSRCTISVSITMKDAQKAEFDLASGDSGNLFFFREKRDVEFFNRRTYRRNYNKEKVLYLTGIYKWGKHELKDFVDNHLDSLLVISNGDTVCLDKGYLFKMFKRNRYRRNWRSFSIISISITDKKLTKWKRKLKQNHVILNNK